MARAPSSRTEQQQALDRRLRAAAVDGEVDVVRDLIARGARGEEADQAGQTAFMQAAANGHAELLPLLLPVSDPGATLPPAQMSALSLAAMAGQAESVAFLLSCCDARRANIFGETPLMIAVNRGDSGCVRLLLPVSDADAKTSVTGETALMLAVMSELREALECFNLLLPHSDVRLRKGPDEEGFAHDLTPLRMLVDSAQWLAIDPNGQDAGLARLAAMARGLVLAGSDLSARDQSGRSVVDMARRAQSCVFSTAFFEAIAERERRQIAAALPAPSASQSGGAGKPPARL
jgi:ankyrin repeat protein